MDSFESTEGHWGNFAVDVDACDDVAGNLGASVDAYLCCVLLFGVGAGVHSGLGVDCDVGGDTDANVRIRVSICVHIGVAVEVDAALLAFSSANRNLEGGELKD